MDVLLPNTAWDSQICSECKKYLSYGPVNVSSRGSIKLIKCGRCIVAQEDQSTISSYDVVAKHLIFPCVNRYEGCTQLLRYEDVPGHEETCMGGQYVCPLCPAGLSGTDSVLCLLDHYKSAHPKSVLSKPVIDLPVNSSYEDCLIHYDNSENTCVFICVKLDSAKLNVNASTIGNRVGQLKHRIRIIADGRVRFTSEFRPCTSFDNNVSMFSVELPQYLIDCVSIVSCALDFDCSQVPNCLIINHIYDLVDLDENWQDGELEHYGTSLGPKFEDVDVTKKFPNVYFTNEVPRTKVAEKNGISYLVTNFFQATHLYCDFCENYCVSEQTNSMLVCNSCNKSVCQVCYNSCQTYADIKCPFCGGGCYYNSFSIRPKLLYYCSYGCDHFFKGNELKFHQKHCHMNIETQLTELEVGQRYFGNYFYSSSYESKTIVHYENTMLINNTILGNTGKIYMITETFHCLIFYQRFGDIYRFRVAHKYLPNKFYVLVRTVQGVAREDTNNFSLNSNQLAFFVVLLKVKKDHKRGEPTRNLKRTLVKFGAQVTLAAGVFLFYVYFWKDTVQNISKVKQLFKRMFVSNLKNNNLASEHNVIEKNKFTKGVMGNIFFGAIGAVLYCFKHMENIRF